MHLEVCRGCGCDTGNDAVSTVQRAFNRAVKRGHISVSPVANVENKPKKTRRKTVFTPAQWDELRSHEKEWQFRDLLDFIWAPAAVRWKLEHSKFIMSTSTTRWPSSHRAKPGAKSMSGSSFMPNEALIICRQLITGQMWPSARTIRRHRSSDPWSIHDGKCKESMQSDQCSLF